MRIKKKYMEDYSSFNLVCPSLLHTKKKLKECNNTLLKHSKKYLAVTASLMMTVSSFGAMPVFAEDDYDYGDDTSEGATASVEATTAGDTSLVSEKPEAVQCTSDQLSYTDESALTEGQGTLICSQSNGVYALVSGNENPTSYHWVAWYKNKSDDEPDVAESDGNYKGFAQSKVDAWSQYSDEIKELNGDSFPESRDYTYPTDTEKGQIDFWADTSGYYTVLGDPKYDNLEVTAYENVSYAKEEVTVNDTILSKAGSDSPFTTDSNGNLMVDGNSPAVDKVLDQKSCDDYAALISTEFNVDLDANVCKQDPKSTGKNDPSKLSEKWSAYMNCKTSDCKYQARQQVVTGDDGVKRRITQMHDTKGYTSVKVEKLKNGKWVVDKAALQDIANSGNGAYRYDKNQNKVFFGGVLTAWGDFEVGSNSAKYNGTNWFTQNFNSVNKLANETWNYGKPNAKLEGAVSNGATEQDCINAYGKGAKLKNGVCVFKPGTKKDSSNSKTTDSKTSKSGNEKSSETKHKSHRPKTSTTDYSNKEKKNAKDYLTKIVQSHGTTQLSKKDAQTVKDILIKTNGKGLISESSSDSAIEGELLSELTGGLNNIAYMTKEDTETLKQIVNKTYINKSNDLSINEKSKLRSGVAKLIKSTYKIGTVEQVKKQAADHPGFKDASKSDKSNKTSKLGGASNKRFIMPKEKSKLHSDILNFVQGNNSKKSKNLNEIVGEPVSDTTQEYTVDDAGNNVLRETTTTVSYYNTDVTIAKATVEGSVYATELAQIPLLSLEKGSGSDFTMSIAQNEDSFWKNTKPSYWGNDGKVTVKNDSSTSWHFATLQDSADDFEENFVSLYAQLPHTDKVLPFAHPYNNVQYIDKLTNQDYPDGIEETCFSISTGNGKTRQVCAKPQTPLMKVHLDVDGDSPQVDVDDEVEKKVTLSKDKDGKDSSKDNDSSTSNNDSNSSSNNNKTDTSLPKVDDCAQTPWNHGVCDD